MMVQQIRLLITAVGVVAILCPSHFAEAGAYAFSGLTVDNFIVFKEDSVADPFDLDQGPNRDGSGSRYTSSDFGGPVSGGGQGGGNSTNFENTRVARSAPGDSPQACFVCNHAENDFSRPPLQPVDPTIGFAFGRADSRDTGEIIGSGARQVIDTVAEIEYVTDLTTRPAFGRAVYQRFMIFFVNAADEMVFDFDADFALRSISHPNSPLTKTSANSMFFITIEDASTDTEIFRFAPDGSGIAFGGTVVADPFSLNTSVSAYDHSTFRDEQLAQSGQFRVISPTLVPGVGYSLRFEQWISVTAEKVPEPSSLLLLAAGFLVTPRLCWKRYNYSDSEHSR